MMHDHASHELHFRLRPRRQFGGCGRRQPLARFTWRARLNYYRGRRFSLLCDRSRAEEICWSAHCEEATQHRKCLRRPELAHVAKTIKPRIRNIANHFHLDSVKSCHGILTLSAACSLFETMV